MFTVVAALSDVFHRVYGPPPPSKPQILLLGGPGSGKGTQCEQLAAIYGAVHVSTGSLYRAEAKSGSEVGKVMAEIMAAGTLLLFRWKPRWLSRGMSCHPNPTPTPNLGGLVPDSLGTRVVLKERLEQPDIALKGWIGDGYTARFSTEICTRCHRFFLKRASRHVKEEVHVTNGIPLGCRSLTG
jgi:adenylate kinase family enzyme